MNAVRTVRLRGQASQTLRRPNWWSWFVSSKAPAPILTCDWHHSPLTTQQVETHGSPPTPSVGRTSTVLTTHPPALPAEFLSRTHVLTPTKSVWWERILDRLRLPGLARRSSEYRRAWALFRKAPDFDVVITDGAAVGFAFAFLQSLRSARRPAHVMYDCYWYGGNWLHRKVMQLCLRQVDLCIVWSRVECVRYAKEYRVSPSKFSFVQHHHTLKRYQFAVCDDGYIFAGGNSDRDYGLFLEAVRGLPISCILATNLPRLLAGIQLPENVRVVSASPVEFRQLMARARIVVVPMRANLLRTGGQQTFLNAMYMRKPTIVTDPEGGSDYIAHQKTGVLVPYPDVHALRKAMVYLWEHPDEARTIGERAREVSLPLTTERCNIEIWSLALKLVQNNRSKEAAKIS